MRVRSPFSVSSFAAHPPVMPLPMTMASYSVCCCPVMSRSSESASGPGVADAPVRDVAAIDAHRVDLELRHRADVGRVVAEQGELLHATEEPPLLQLAALSLCGTRVGGGARRIADRGGGTALTHERIAHLGALRVERLGLGEHALRRIRLRIHRAEQRDLLRGCRC